MTRRRPAGRGPTPSARPPTACSERWRATFLATVAPGQTRAEVDFLRRILPLDAYPRVLDLACGDGRHAAPLARAGYTVTGVDVDPEMLAAAAARGAGSGLALVRADMRDLASLDGAYDGVVSMWQSFGYFDAETNRDVVRAAHRLLRPGGRLVLDIYQRRFFETRLGTLRRERDGVTVEERKELEGGRLSVTLTYPETGEVDRFDWQLYSPEEITQVAEREGFGLVLACCGFDESREIVDDRPRMQLVFERARATRTAAP